MTAGSHQPGDRQRQRDPQEGAGRRVRSEVAAGLDQAAVEPFERGVERQDEERDVAVHQSDDHRRTSHRRASCADRSRCSQPSTPVDVSVDLQQVDPGEHAHQVADPEGQHERSQQKATPAVGLAGDVVRHGVADESSTAPAKPDVRRTCGRTRRRGRRRTPGRAPCSSSRSPTATGSTPGRRCAGSGRPCRRRPPASRRTARRTSASSHATPGRRRAPRTRCDDRPARRPQRWSRVSRRP